MNDICTRSISNPNKLIRSTEPAIKRAILRGYSYGPGTQNDNRRYVYLGHGVKFISDGYARGAAID